MTENATGRLPFIFERDKSAERGGIALAGKLVTDILKGEDAD